ncbi:MAG: SAM-dependent methyltransferase [Tannerellaceae bacterium]|nr:SAM-dependent methyltransferase [Tannerellaceae bacterium]
MRILPKNHTIRKGILLYRRFRYRKGHGVHSPFVFRLITKVIEEKLRYYAYDDINLIRKKLHYSQEVVELIEGGAPVPVSTLVRKYDLPGKEGELLFRLANYFKPTHIIQIAPGELYSTLYLNAYSVGTTTYILQEHNTLYALSRKLFPLLYGEGIHMIKGIGEDRLEAVLKEVPAGLIYLDKIAETSRLEAIWQKILLFKKNHTVVVVKGVHENPIKKKFWKDICAHPETTVTVDLYKYGIVLFNKKLHKRTYKAHF